MVRVLWSVVVSSVTMCGLSNAAFAQADGVAIEHRKPYSGHVVAKVSVATPGDVLRVTALAEAGGSVWSHGVVDGKLDVQLTPEGLAALGQLGLPYEVMILDVQALVDAERAQIEAWRRARADGFAGRADDWYTTYHTRAEIDQYIATLATNSAGLATRTQFGTSLEGRPMYAIRVSAPDLPGNPRASRPKVVFNGCQHAREWVTPPTVTYIAERLIAGYSADTRIQSLLNRCEVIVIPIVNPDGYEYTWTTQRLWRKNRRNNGDGSFGVDLNRNWSVGWGGNDGSSPSPSSETYRGPAAFSEPESVMLRDFMTSLDSGGSVVAGSIDIHSYSQLILSPLGYTTTLPPNAAFFDSLNVQLESSIESVFGTDYVAGPTATTIYVASGTASDWSFGALGSVGYGMEMRDTGEFGFVLPADQILPTAQENFQLALTFAEGILTPLRFFFPSGQPTSVAGMGSLSVQIDDGAATLNTSSPMLYWRQPPQQNFAAVSMTASGRVFSASLPTLYCNRGFEYYIQAATTAGETATFPASGAFSATVAGQSTAGFTDACESADGWTVGAPGDTATTGMWTNNVPEQTTAQPGSDASPVGTRCWVTDHRAGNGAGAWDVDNGITTLTSPAFSGLGPDGTTARVSYRLWYSNDRGNNPNTNSLPVQISNNNGATWTQLELVSQSTNAWSLRSFRISDFITPTANMRLRFIARDLTSALIEAAVDDISVEFIGCPSDPADFNGDGFVDGFDYDDFVSCFEAIACPPGKSADFNNDGFVDGFDYDEFVAAFEGA